MGKLQNDHRMIFLFIRDGSGAKPMLG